MVVGIERLRRAGEILGQAGRAAAGRDAAVEAAAECWSAAIDAGLWPLDLQVRVAVLKRTMFLYGPIPATVGQMTDRELRRFCEEMLDFVEAAERALAQGA